MRELYKYRPFDLRSLQMLQERTIWVSGLRKLNDPYEYTFAIEPDMDYEEVAARNKAATRDNYRELQNDFISKIAEEFEPGGVYCLSSRNDIELSWAHYADSHHGFCIGFPVGEDGRMGNARCYPVRYGDAPTISFRELFQALESGEERLAIKIFTALALCKGERWSYEEERRLVYAGQPDRLIALDFAISSITFGMRMPAWQRSVVRKLLGDEDGIRYYETKKSAGYRIEIAAL